VTGRKRLPADLAARVAEKKLTPGEAKVIATARLKREQEERLKREREENGPKPGDVWRRHNLPVPQTGADYTAYARYILAHWPALGDDVISGSMKLSEAVLIVHQRRCPFPCDQHEPLTAGQREALMRAMAGGAR